MHLSGVKIFSLGDVIFIWLEAVRYSNFSPSFNKWFLLYGTCCIEKVELKKKKVIFKTVIKSVCFFFICKEASFKDIWKITHSLSVKLNNIPPLDPMWAQKGNCKLYKSHFTQNPHRHVQVLQPRTFAAVVTNGKEKNATQQCYLAKKTNLEKPSTSPLWGVNRKRHNILSCLLPAESMRHWGPPHNRTSHQPHMARKLWRKTTFPDSQMVRVNLGGTLRFKMQCFRLNKIPEERDREDSMFCCWSSLQFDNYSLSNCSSNGIYSAVQQSK